MYRSPEKTTEIVWFVQTKRIVYQGANGKVKYSELCGLIVSGLHSIIVVT